MQLTITIPQATIVEVPYSFPLYRSRLQGEYNVAGFKKEYWKFESIHKVTKITEEMCQTTILTLDDVGADFIKDIMCADMLYGQGAYDVIPEKIYDDAVNRLINKLYIA